MFWGHLEIAGRGPVTKIWGWQFSPRWVICSAMNGNGRGNALVSGKEDKVSLAGFSRKVSIAGKESDLGGQLWQRYPVVSRGHMQVTRVTSGRNWPVYWAEKPGLILSISQLLSHLCLHTHSTSRWFFSVKIKRERARSELSGILGMSGVKMQASSMSVIPC